MTKIPHTVVAACAATVLTCFLGFASAYGQAPDNSRENKAQSQSADDQTNATSDRLTTASVRKAIVADKQLSTYAHNVKIITHDGHVTLKGPVKSEEEKQQVLSDVANALPTTHISNELTVKE